MKPTFLRYSTLAYRLVLLGCSFAVLYLQNHYVNKETYERDRTEIFSNQQSMQRLLATMEEKNRVNDRQDEQLKDHENRLRTLERKRP